jgi:hypothetical protein
MLSLGLGAWAGGKTYTVTLYDPAMAGATELQPGEYKLDVDNDKAVIHKGKLSAENPVKIETAGEKYGATSLLLVKGDGKLHIKEIHLGGTKTKLVFTETQP